MGYKTILVHAQADERARRRLNLALSLAETFDACVYGVAAESWRPITTLPEYGFVPGEIIEELEQDAAKRLSQAKVVFEDLAKARALRSLWTSAPETPAEVLTRCAEGADLIVADRPADPGAEGLCARPGTLALTAGLPVLIVSDAHDTLTAEAVVVGWKNTRESRRAVSDAMPFLRRAKQVHLVQVAPQGEAAEVRSDLEQAAGRLSRQGVNVATELLGERSHVCEALEACAARHGADLIVLGAYGHSRMREVVFGGVTQGFLQRGVVHVLMSH